MILGIVSEKVSNGKDIDSIFKKDSNNITVCNGNKPIPKNVVKPFKITEDTGDDRFINNMKNILRQSSKDIQNITIKNYIINNTCTNECEKGCQCKKMKDKR